MECSEDRVKRPAVDEALKPWPLSRRRSQERRLRARGKDHRIADEVDRPIDQVDGLDLGLNARAALITRGLAEMTRLGAALGARPETFMGLSGLGDLVLTCTGALSRNPAVSARITG